MVFVGRRRNTCRALVPVQRAWDGVGGEALQTETHRERKREGKEGEGQGWG